MSKIRAASGDGPEGAEYNWWRGAVIYEVYVRSFRDANGDGVGDLRGVLEKLDYISDLGVDAIWLSPFYKSPQFDFGYDIADFRIIDPSSGTMEDFLDVLDAAHERNLRVLLDLVPAHTSHEHPWFQESRSGRDVPKADWYVWADRAVDGGPPNNWLSSFGGSAWEWEPRRGQYYYHAFLTSQPTLNLHNPEVLDAVLKQMRYWMDRGVDGFRVDAVQCLAYDPALRDNPPSGPGDPRLSVGGGPGNPFRCQMHLFDRNAYGTDRILRAMRATADEKGCLLIGELADVDSAAVAGAFTEPGAKLHAVYDFDLINCEAEVDGVSEILERRSDLRGHGWIYNVFSNHDTQRAVSNLTHFVREELRPEAAKMLLFMQLTLHGGAVIYQGEELGLPDPQLEFEELQDPWAKAFWPDFVGRDGARIPFPWSASDKHGGFSDAETVWLKARPEYAAMSAAVQLDDKKSVLSFARDFISWRGRQVILRVGSEFMGPRDEAPLISWYRQHEGKEWLFAVNFSEDPAFLSLEEAWDPVPAPGCVTAVGDHGMELGPLAFSIIERPLSVKT